MVLPASAGGIAGATSAIFPAAIATSRTASTPLRASMTCPPLSSRSYLGVDAGACGRTGPAATAARTPAVMTAIFVIMPAAARTPAAWP